jgi:hypothetical protein
MCSCIQGREIRIDTASKKPGGREGRGSRGEYNYSNQRDQREYRGDSREDRYRIRDDGGGRKDSPRDGERDIAEPDEHVSTEERTSEPVPVERKRLALKPRTLPLEEGQKQITRSTSIFGTGKPRDESDVRVSRVAVCLPVFVWLQDLYEVRLRRRSWSKRERLLPQRLLPQRLRILRQQQL